jgi:hypothetical protein
MPFGKYQGTLLVKLPEAYLAWFARKGMPQGKLGMLLESALVIRQNGLDALIAPILKELQEKERRGADSSPQK